MTVVQSAVSRVEPQSTTHTSGSVSNSQSRSVNKPGSIWQKAEAPGVESITRDGAVLIKRQLPRWGSALAPLNQLRPKNQ